jgi:hypothetical protein
VPTRRLFARLRVELFLGAVASIGCLVECSRNASASDCQSIAEHYVDLAARESAGSTAMSSAQLAAVRQIEEAIKHAEPAYRTVVDRCRDVDRAAASCAMRASTTFAWETCIRASDGRR